MKKYKQEIADGLSDQIETQASVTYNSPIIIPDAQKKVEIISHASEIKTILKMACERNDLAAIQSILVSTGWNGNTDIFTPLQLWAARFTPVLKQVNLNHTDQIVGTMVHSVAVDFDGNLLSDDLEASEVPDEFDLVVDSVLYTRHPNKELREEVAELLPKIANGEAYVSMECFFNDFDYGIITADGDKFIVPRTEETSWITKHLLQFGGAGSVEIEGTQYAIGRVIKNLTFSGIGIVENPANKRSVIFPDMKTFAKATVSETARFTSQSQITTDKEDDMSQETVSLKEHDELKAKLAQLENQEKAKLASDLEASLAEKAELETANQKLADELKAEKELRKEESKAAEEALEVKSQEVQAKADELEKASKELDTMKESVATASRVNKLVGIGQSEDEAKEIVAKWSGSTDEQFAGVVELQEKLAKASQSASEDENVEEEEESSASELEVDDEGQSAPVVGDEASQASEDEQVEACASYMSVLISKQKNK